MIIKTDLELLDFTCPINRLSIPSDSPYYTTVSLSYAQFDLGNFDLENFFTVSDQ